MHWHTKLFSTFAILMTSFGGIAFCQSTADLYEFEPLMEPAQAWGINEASQSVGFTQNFFDFQKTPRYFADGNVIQLDAPNFFAAPVAINNSQTIVGWATFEFAPNQAARWLGPMTDVELLSGLGDESQAWDVNDAGQIVGWLGDHQQRTAYIWKNGNVQLLDTFGGLNSEAFAVNSSGQITGYAETNSGQRHVFLWDNGVLNDLGNLLGAGGTGYGLNDSGVIVGESAMPDGQTTRPFRWEQGVVQDLGTFFNYDRGQASAVSEDGDTVVGHVWASGNPAVTETAFIYRNGQLTRLRDLIVDGPMVDSNLRIIRAYDMNSSGDITGLASYGGLQYAYTLRSVQVSYDYDVAAITPPNGALTLRVKGFNDNGDVVGWSFLGSFVDPPYQGWQWSQESGATLLPLPGGPSNSFAGGDINTAGQITGSTPFEFGSCCPWRLDGGKFTFIDLLPETTWAITTDINENGDIVGFGDNYSPTGTSERFFFHSDDTGLLEIPEVPNRINRVSRLNESRVVVGTVSGDPSDPTSAWRWAPGETSLELLSYGPGFSSARDINNFNQVAGSVTIDDGPPFIPRPALYTDGIGWEIVGGISNGIAQGTNDNEIVVGSMGVAGISRGFVWTRDSGVTILEEVLNQENFPPGSRISSTVDVNEAGQILAVGVSNDEAYLLTPVDGLPPGQSAAAPTTFNLINGQVIASSLVDLFTSDDAYMALQAEKLLRPDEPAIWIELSRQIESVTANSIAFDIESFVNKRGLELSVEAFDFADGAYTQLHSQPASIIETTVTVSISKDASRFIDSATGEIRFRVGWRGRGGPIRNNPRNPRNPWTARIDHARWIISEN